MTRRLAPADVVSVAFVVPLQGPTGIYGPSCLACGELAVEQLNASTGIAGRQVELVVVDAGRDPALVAEDVPAASKPSPGGTSRRCAKR